VSVLPRITSLEPVASPSSTSEPAVIERERATLREVLRLVSERADAEASVESARSSGDATADQEYQKARRSLVEKFDMMEASDRQADELRRRSIIDAAIAGES
jgi:DNA segregation ATPase FtsK/SpoIIIE, S-DNA-T family